MKKISTLVLFAVGLLIALGLDSCKKGDDSEVKTPDVTQMDNLPSSSVFNNQGVHYSSNSDQLYYYNEATVGNRKISTLYVLNESTGGWLQVANYDGFSCAPVASSDGEAYFFIHYYQDALIIKMQGSNPPSVIYEKYDDNFGFTPSTITLGLLRTDDGMYFGFDGHSDGHLGLLNPIKDTMYQVPWGDEWAQFYTLGNNVYSAQDDRLLKLNKDHYEFEPYLQTNDANGYGFRDFTGYSVHYDNEGNLYMATIGGDILVWNKNDDKPKLIDYSMPEGIHAAPAIHLLGKEVFFTHRPQGVCENDYFYKFNLIDGAYQPSNLFITDYDIFTEYTGNCKNVWFVHGTPQRAFIYWSETYAPYTVSKIVFK
ncbi:hypothetical protein GC194_05910 [bacterium]|nr:hypothetical protein [bacterium]